MGYWGYPQYVSVAEKKAKAERKLKQLQKKNPNIKPVIIEGRTIARTWWGKSWTVNLERYADYVNRIARGRSYVRNKAVLDLQITPGVVNSLVQGTASRPYVVTIKIEEIPKNTWRSIKKECEGKIDSLQELLMGRFPEALSEVFTAKGQGLFPSPKEIEFSCSCPDWAYMCKHVAATLYGIGARLDEDPALFFELRGANIDDLIAQAVEDKTKTLLEKASKKSTKVIDNANISDIFGIDLEGDENVVSHIEPKIDLSNSPKQKTSAFPAKKEPQKTSKPKVKKEKTKPLTQKQIKKSSAKKQEKKRLKTSVKHILRTKVITSDDVAKIIKRTRKGIDIPTLKKKTGFEERKLYNIIFKLKKEGKIRSISRGIYKGA